MANQIHRREWRWSGNTIRKPQDCVTAMEPAGQEETGPKLTWKRSVGLEFRKSRSDWQRIARLVQDRSEWHVPLRSHGGMMMMMMILTSTFQLIISDRFIGGMAILHMPLLLLCLLLSEHIPQSVFLIMTLTLT